MTGSYSEELHDVAHFNLHSRDTILDNRRLLVRLFAYAPHSEPLVLQSDPLVVSG